MASVPQLRALASGAVGTSAAVRRSAHSAAGPLPTRWLEISSAACTSGPTVSCTESERAVLT